VTLRSFTIANPPAIGSDCELELRAVGPLLTVKFNGETVGEVQDATLASGFFAMTNTVSEPVFVKTLQFLPLDAPAKNTPSANLPVSKSSDPKFPPGQWVKLFTKPEDLPTDQPELKWENGWISAEKGTGLYAANGRMWTNAGTRFRTRITDRRLAVATIRDTNPADKNSADKTSHHYQFRGDTASRTWILDYLREAKPKAITEQIGQWPLQPDELSDGKEHLLEVAAVKDKIIARVDSRLLGVVTDSRISSGRLSPFILSPVRDIEVINLDGLPEAEALRLLGVDEKDNDLRGKTK
jgi:hypothetical protein